jgi:hypothetical protein
MAELLEKDVEVLEEVNVDELEVEESEEMTEDEMVLMFGEKPEDAPVAPQTHGMEESL